VLDYSVISQGKLQHWNKGQHALRVEVLSLYKGDSSFNHVSLYSPTIPGLAGMHQKTFTMHSHWKRDIVVWRSGVWGDGIVMHPKISLSHESVVSDTWRSPNASFILSY
jgi:hypothetical protein